MPPIVSTSGFYSYTPDSGGEYDRKLAVAKYPDLPEVIAVELWKQDTKIRQMELLREALNIPKVTASYATGGQTSATYTGYIDGTFSTGTNTTWTGSVQTNKTDRGGRTN